MVEFRPFSLRKILLPIVLGLVLGGSSLAQEAPELRFPAEGLSIVDCDPPAPAPPDSCILRLPPSLQRGTITREQVGSERVNFDFSRSVIGAGKPVTLSATLLLVDLSPGLETGRAATWKVERTLMAQFLRGLPNDEPVALYGFNQSINRLADFTLDHEALARQIETLELSGTNTNISTAARDAVEVLAGLDSTVLRTLILITDGDEEGTRTPAEVEAKAVHEGVVISALGMFWRPSGAERNGQALDYLRQLTEGTRGTIGTIELRGSAQDRSASLSSFQSQVNSGLAGSGLIVPLGTPAAADIVVTLRRPVIGQPGQFRDDPVRVRFIPAAERHPPPAPEPAPAPPPPQVQPAPMVLLPAPEPPPPASLFDRLKSETWFSVPKLWWLAGATMLGLLALILAVVFRPRDATPITEAGLDTPPQEPLSEDGWDTPADVIPPPPSPAPALAWLIRDDSGERLAMRSPRVTLGRAPDCDLVIDHNSVSRLHCEILRTATDSFTVSDRGSLNGTLLNGRKIGGVTTLHPGDSLTLGSVSLRFSVT